MKRRLRTHACLRWWRLALWAGLLVLLCRPLAPEAQDPVQVGCDTYCLNGVSVNSPFCECAPPGPEEPGEPDGDGDLSTIIGILVTLGVLGVGSVLARRFLSRKPRPQPAPQAERVLVDALGREHRYVRDAQGRYINPETGGELDESLWAEFNRNLAANQQFVERERQKQSARDTAFDREMDQMVEDQKQRERDLHAVQQMAQSLLFNPDRSGLWRGPGEPGDMYSNLEDLREQLMRGDDVDRRRLDAARRLYRDHTQGTVLAPEEMPTEASFYREADRSAMEATLREAITGQDSEGGTSWKGMGLRMLANLATAGHVELVLTPLESLYTMHSYVEQGGDSPLKGFLSTAANIVVGEIMSAGGEAGARWLFGAAKVKPQLPRAATPRSPSPSRYANAGLDMHPHLAGMPDANIRHAQRVAQKNNVQILVRPTNPEARALLEKGLARPKPMAIKNKTINRVDTFLGVGAEDLGKVGHFKPTLPPKAKIPPELYDKVKQRYVQRLNEFRDQAEHVRQLQKQGKVVQRNGVLYEALPGGTPGKPYSGDHDLFEILDANGRPCPESLKQHVLKELQQPPFSAQHGAHMDWDYSHYSPTPGPGGAQSPQNIAKGIDRTIRASHGPGQEPLIRFGAGTHNPISGSYYVGA